jgi:VanZ family protein
VKRNRGWALACAAYAAAILYVSVIPIPDGPQVPYLDKVAHLCQYLLFAWLLVQAVRTARLKEQEYVALAWMFATSYGILIELIQGLLPWRSADVGDGLFNAAGAALGAWVGRFLPRPRGDSTK